MNSRFDKFSKGENNDINSSFENEEEELKKINYSDFLKDTEKIEEEIKIEEELKKQKRKEKIKILEPIRNKQTDERNMVNGNDFDNTEAEKADKIKKRTIIFFAAAFVLTAIYFSISYSYYSNKYLPSTVINGENCSGKTVEEVSEIMREKINNYHLSIVYNDITVDELYGTDINLSFGDMEQVLQNICDNQKKLSWLKGLIFESEPINTSKGLEYNAVVLNQFIKSSMILTSTTKSVNAGLEFDNGEYKIVPAVYGDEIDQTAFTEKLADAVNSLNSSVNINKDDCFIKPELTEDNENLIKSCKTANKIINNKIELNAADDLFDIPVEIKKDWLNVDNTGILIFDNKAFSKYMDRIEKSYCSDSGQREFKTFHGDTVTVTGGDFNSSVNRNKLSKDMEEAMLSNKAARVVVEIITNDNTDIGNSYIEVDLSNQMLWMYVNGEQVLGTPVITGKDDGEHTTPEGIFRLKAKNTNTFVTETGESKNVSYWMSVNGEIGICDASWKNLFGGTVYKEEGSDGSIYVLKDSAKTIYENSFENMPVILYHHSIVESFFIENSYMGELMDLIANSPEIPEYEGEEGTEATSEEIEEGEESTVTEDNNEEITKKENTENTDAKSDTPIKEDENTADKSSQIQEELNPQIDNNSEETDSSEAENQE